MQSHSLWRHCNTSPQQIGVHEASVCVSLVLEILCLNKINFNVDVVRMVCFHVFGCALSVYHLSSHWVRVCWLWFYVVMEHTVNSKWFEISTSWTQNPEHTLGPICCDRLATRHLMCVATNYWTQSIFANTRIGSERINWNQISIFKSSQQFSSPITQKCLVFRRIYKIHQSYKQPNVRPNHEICLARDQQCMQKLNNIWTTGE